MTSQKIISDLKKLENSKSAEHMVRFGINPESALGITIPILRKKAKEIGVNHKIALELWDSGIHEVRILASMIDDPKLVTKSQMNTWVKDFNSWDLCDQCCNNLFRKTKFAEDYPFIWVKSKSEYIRRAGFVMMAVNAVHNKKMTNQEIAEYFSIIIKYSDDNRNFVKKAVNWALRQIGKRNINLNKEAIIVCEQLIAGDSLAANWIASDALRELTSEKIISRLQKKRN